MNLATIASVSVGQHLYWHFGSFVVHGESLLTSWFVFLALVLVSLLGNGDLKSIPEGLQNVTEFGLEFIRDIAKTQIGEEEHKEWVPFIGTIFYLSLCPIGQEPYSLGVLLSYQMVNLEHPQMILIQRLR